MATEKYFCFDEQGELKRIKGRLVRFLDNEAPTGSDKSAIRTSLEVSPDAEGLVQADVGTDPNEIPVNGMLGDLAYQSAAAVSMGTAEVDTLEVTDKITGNLGIGGSNTYPLTVSKTGDNVKADFTNTVNANFRIGTSGSAVQIGPSTSSSLELQTGGTTRWTINSTGNLVAGANLGIDFGAVAGGTGTPATDGGLLNDYERGSFTPSFTSTGTAPTLTYLAQVGTYTKVGNLVTCHGRVRVNAVTGAGTGSLQISGLPFSTQNVSNLQSGGAVCLSALFGTSSSGCPTHLSGANNATVMTLKTLKNSAGVVASLDNTDAADLAGSCFVDFSITYTTA